MRSIWKFIISMLHQWWPNISTGQEVMVMWLFHFNVPFLSMYYLTDQWCQWTKSIKAARRPASLPIASHFRQDKNHYQYWALWRKNFLTHSVSSLIYPILSENHEFITSFMDLFKAKINIRDQRFVNFIQKYICCNKNAQQVCHIWDLVDQLAC